eukprot:CAMPEP_0198116778 /NCGR_PEP_ID=MMETSP1442-20131203/14457_1 /TAXON_ID= /ORGANISM="Craspedostauros australis, Strain CCMP3328" /LENGTH=330 /DNA_ID=CAMNT_0043774681 /DNA_START=57 /DNA_END=1049 /DNA_ORIENTATION=+
MFIALRVLTLLCGVGMAIGFSASPLSFHQRVSQPRQDLCLQASSDGDDTSSDAELRQVVDWAKSEPLDSLLPRDDAKSILAELLSSDSLIDDSEALVAINWEKIEARLKAEDRSIAQLLGDGSTDSVLKAVGSIEGYDSDAVRAFLSSDAISSLFSRILYDGIFEFFQRIDVFGNIVNGLPIIGPIRKQIVTETKKQLDRSLGPLVQNFLSTYTKIAVVQAGEYVLSPSNRKSFASANVRLVSNILERPINSVLPPEDLTDKVQEASFDFLRKLESDKVNEYVDVVYDFLGDKKLESAVDVDKVLDASPTLEASLVRILERSRATSEASK